MRDTVYFTLPTGLGIKERFILMCAAFGCNQYEVDNDLSVME